MKKSEMKKMIKCLLSGLLVTAMLVLSIPVEVKAGQSITVPIMFEQNGQNSIVNWPAILRPDGSAVIEQICVSNKGTILLPAGTIVDNAVFKGIEEITIYDPAATPDFTLDVTTLTENFMTAKTKTETDFYNAIYKAIFDAVSAITEWTLDDVLVGVVEQAIKDAIKDDAIKDAVLKALDAGLTEANIRSIAVRAAKAVALDAGLSKSGQAAASLAAYRAASEVLDAAKDAAGGLKSNDENPNQGVYIANCILLNSNCIVSGDITMGLLRTSGTIDPASSVSAWKVESIGDEEATQLTQVLFDTNGETSPPAMPQYNFSGDSDEKQEVQGSGVEAEAYDKIDP